MNNKVLFILHLPPPVHGSSMVGQYIKESSVINNNFECSYINLGTSSTVDEIGQNPLVKIGRYLRIVFKVLKQLSTNKPELCYLAITAKGLAFYKDSLIVLLVKCFGVRMVYHFHNKGVSTRQHKALDNFLYRKVFKNAHAILLSKHLYSDIQKYIPENNVYYCPNGIPESVASQKPKESKNPVEILFLSNLIESKGVFVLLESCKILEQKGLTFHCTYVGGEGNVTAQQFQEMVKKRGLTEHVVYAGKKYGIEKDESFSKADIFAFPTYYDNECFPLVLLEAMQHSLPIVSTFEGGIRDIVNEEETGFLVPQKNAKVLAEKLELLIKNPPLRVQMGEAGRKKYEQEFTLSKFEAWLKRILMEITG